MLSPKTPTIMGDAGTWDETQKGIWLPILVGSDMFQRSAFNFGDLETRLGAVASGSLKAKQLGAALTHIDRIGPVDASSDGQDGKYSTKANREGFIEYALSVLYGQDFNPRYFPISTSTRTSARF